MDILKRITELRQAREWTEYQMAEQAGLTQSTVSTWYRKNLTPTIPSLEKICDAFGITLSQFFAEDSEKSFQLTDNQIRLVKYAAKLDSKQINALINFIDLL